MTLVDGSRGGVVQNFISSMPRMTKYWFLLTLGFSLCCRVNPKLLMYFALTYDDLVNNFEIWRLFTCIVTYPLTPRTGYMFLVNMYLLYTVSMGLQAGNFSEREGDYFYMLVFFSTVITIVSLFIYRIFFLCESLIMAALYVWSQLNSEREVSFLFGFRMKAMYLPYVIVLMEIILFFRGMEELIGMLVGHLYFFLVYKYPMEFGGRQFLNTPRWVKKIFPNRIDQMNTNQFNTSGGGNTSTESANIRSHVWGSGRRLVD